MPTPVPPEGGPVPRPRRTPRPAPPDPNGHTEPAVAPSAWPHHEKRLLAAIEEMRLARIEYERVLEGKGKPVADDAEYQRVARMLEDVENIGKGPQPRSLPHIEPPAVPNPYLVDGFIRPGTTVMLTGPAGGGKSWAARQLAFGCAAGVPLFLDHYAIARPMQVLVIDEDNGPGEEWRRDEAVLAFLGLQRGDLGNLSRMSLENIMLDAPKWQAWLRAQIQGNALDLVVLDPISEMHAGKEIRDDPGFRSMLTFLKRLKTDFVDLATLLVHHTRKAMSGDRSKERGLDDVRGQWGQTPDVIALMWPLAERRVAWELHKRVPHSKLILEATEAGPLIYKADSTTSRSRAMQNDDAVIAAIRGGLVTFAEIHEGIEMAKGTLSGVLKRLVGSNTIRRDGDTYEMIEEER